MAVSKKWAVKVYADSEHILTIGDDFHGGDKDIIKHSDTIRNCAESLLFFIGKNDKKSNIDFLKVDLSSVKQLLMDAHSANDPVGVLQYTSRAFEIAEEIISLTD